MRVAPFCMIGLCLLLVGCAVNEESTEPKGRSRSNTTECKDGDCCSGITRAGLLTKSLEKSENGVASETK